MRGQGLDGLTAGFRGAERNVYREGLGIGT